MKMLFFRLVRKLHLQTVAYLFLKPFFNGKSNKSHTEAEKELQECYPFLNNSAIRRNEISENPVYDLVVIIAAYNAEKYLKECLDSVLSQKTKYTYKVIIVDDGSTDNTANIIKEYESSKVEVIHKENGGAATARNKALEKLESKYVMFVDSDDTLEENAIEIFMNCAFSNNADVVECGYNFFNEKKSFVGRCFETKVVDSAVEELSGFMCMKAFKSSLFESVCLPEEFWFEDTVLAMLLFPKVKKAVTLSDVLYNYRLSEASMSRVAKGNKKSVDSFWVMKQLLSDAEKMGIEMNGEYYRLFLRQVALTFSRTFYLSEKVKEAIFVLSRVEMDKYFKAMQEDKGFWYIELSNALKNNNYKRYKLILSLNENLLL